MCQSPVSQKNIINYGVAEKIIADAVIHLKQEASMVARVVTDVSVTTRAKKTPSFSALILLTTCFIKIIFFLIWIIDFLFILYIIELL